MFHAGSPDRWVVLNTVNTMNIKSAQVVVVVKRKEILVKIPAGENSTDMKTLVEGELHRETKTEDNTWSLESGKKLMVSIFYTLLLSQR